MKHCVEFEQPLEKGSYVAMPHALAQHIRAYLGTCPHDEVAGACATMKLCQLFEITGEENEDKK